MYEYPAVGLAERNERIELAEEVVVGERDDDDNYRFYDAGGPKLDGDGNLYVLDAGNTRVQVFDRDGDYLRTLGRRGQGPGELLEPRELVVAADRIVVVDFANRRFSLWTLGGSPAGDVGFFDDKTPSRLFGLARGGLVGRITYRPEEVGADRRSSGYRIVKYDHHLRDRMAIEDQAPARQPRIVRQDGTLRLALPVAVPSHAASPTGEIYTAQGEEYEVHAFAHDGTLAWTVRVEWPRLPIRDEEIVAALDRARRRIPDVTRAEAQIPEDKPALSHVAVDGHGHVYVFPYREDFEAPDWPVDVYSADGELLFSGLIGIGVWGDASGDSVYSVVVDDQTGEERVIRYQLVEPFSSRRSASGS